MISLLTFIAFACLPDRFKALCMFLPPFWGWCFGAWWADTGVIAALYGLWC